MLMHTKENDEMNEELQKAITEVINSSLSTVKEGGAFLQAQLPDYVLQLLTWYSWYNFILFLLGVVAMAAAVIADIKAYKYIKAQNYADTLILEWGIIGMIPRSFIWCLIFLGLINLTWLQIWVAPKVWIVNYAAALVK
jgi:hypothetical protein